MNNKLLEDDIYSIINTGYASYLEFSDQPKELFYKFALLQDTAEMENYTLHYDNNQAFTLYSSEPDYPPVNFGRAIDPSKIKEFKLIPQTYVDSINSKKDWNQTNRITAITKPYRPAFSKKVIVQLFSIPHDLPTSCIPNHYTSLIFESVNGNWTCVDSKLW